jgi:allantoinase
MDKVDLVIRGAQVFLPHAVEVLDVGVEGGRIAVLGGAMTGREEVDAEGCVLLPGAIDAHVHYNEPGRTDWEGWGTGSLASAAGGATCVFEMPLNAHPPTLDGESFRLKRAAAEASSVLDFALWGGLTPVNLATMEELAECGVIGFKAFMSNSGMDDFRRSDGSTLREGMKIAARVGLPVAVHAEDEALAAALASAARGEGRVSVRDYLDSRPPGAEVAAIREACEIAGETGCRLHIVHVSCGEGLIEVAAAQNRGVDVSAETCPHYLLLTESDVERLGAVAKCAPPVRPEETRVDMIRRVRRGEVLTIGTDHSPCPPAMKEGQNFFQVWGGIMGAQQFLPGLRGAGLDWEEIARLTAVNVAQRFGLADRKGRIAPGFDADLVLLDERAPWLCRGEDLVTRHRISPYAGRSFPAAVAATWVRGGLAWSKDGGRGTVRGRLVTRSS